MFRQGVQLIQILVSFLDHHTWDNYFFAVWLTQQVEGVYPLALYTCHCFCQQLPLHMWKTPPWNGLLVSHKTQPHILSSHNFHLDSGDSHLDLDHCLIDFKDACLTLVPDYWFESSGPVWLWISGCEYLAVNTTAVSHSSWHVRCQFSSHICFMMYCDDSFLFSRSVFHSSFMSEPETVLQSSSLGISLIICLANASSSIIFPSGSRLQSSIHPLLQRHAMLKDIAADLCLLISCYWDNILSSEHPMLL